MLLPNSCSTFLKPDLMQKNRAISRPLYASMLALLSACGDPLGIEATQPVFTEALGVYALSKAPPSYPTAVDTPFGQAVPVNVSASFDFAFDLDAAGNILVHPPRRVLTSPAGVNRVALQKVAGTFESVDRAPTSGFVKDSSIVVAIGEVVVVEAERTRTGDYCAFAISPHLYSKFVVDAVDPVVGTITLRLTVDPNCGFRSFTEGIPRS
jgi:hypothetical protein